MEWKIERPHFAVSEREFIYLVALGIFVFYRIISISTFYPPYALTRFVRYLCIALICYKCIYYDRIKANALICLGLLLCGGIVIRLKTGYMTPIITGFFILGAYKVDFDKIIKCFCYIGGMTYLFVFLASQTGIIPDLVFVRWGIAEHSFGYTYTTDFVHQMFFLIIANIYRTRNTGFRWSAFIIYCALGIISYYFCRSRLGSGSIILAAAAYIYMNKRDAKRHQVVERFFLKYSVLLFSAVTILSIFLYSAKSTFWKLFDQFMTGRLTIGKRAFEQYSISLFGQRIIMRGSGKNVKGNIDALGEYFYLDSGYIYTLFCFGIICFCLLVVGYTLLLKKEYKRKNYYFCTIMVLVAIHGSISAQILDVVNNIFLLSFFSAINPDCIKICKGSQINNSRME